MYQDQNSKYVWSIFVVSATLVPLKNFIILSHLTTVPILSEVTNCSENAQLNVTLFSTWVRQFKEWSIIDLHKSKHCM